MNKQVSIVIFHMILLILSNTESDEERVFELAEKDTHDDIAEFLKTIDMEEFVENVIESCITGDMAIGEQGEEFMSEQGMSPVTYVRFRVLYHRHLLQKTSELGKKCPVGKVMEYFEQYPLLKKRARVITDNDIDGEMLLEALNSEAASSELRKHLTATGWGLIEKNFRGFVERLTQ